MIEGAENLSIETEKRLIRYYAHFKDMEKFFHGKECHYRLPSLLISLEKPVIPAPVENDFKNIVQFLIKYDNYVETYQGSLGSPGYTPLNRAIQFHHPEIVKILLENGGSMHLPGWGCSALTLAVSCPARGKSTQVIELLLKNGHEVDAMDNCYNAPLEGAIDLNDINATKILLKYGANVNDCKRSSLHVALLQPRNSYELTETLLKYAAEIDVNVMDEYLKTPLAFAIGRNHPEKLLQLLILYGADINYKFPNGSSLIHYSIRRRTFIAIKTLMSHGLSMKIKNEEGEDALEYALKEHFSIAKLLIYTSC